MPLILYNLEKGSFSNSRRHFKQDGFVLYRIQIQKQLLGWIINKENVEMTSGDDTDKSITGCC